MLVNLPVLGFLLSALILVSFKLSIDFSLPGIFVQKLLVRCMLGLY